MPMTTKLGMLVTYLEQLLSVKSHDHIITWFCKITWQTKIIYLLPQCLPNLAGWGYILWWRGVVVITTAQLHSTKPEHRFCTVSNPACNVSEIRDGKDTVVLTGNKAKRLSLVNHTTKTLHHHHTVRNFLVQSHNALQPSGLARSHEKLDLLYLYYHRTYGCQICQEGNLLYQAFNHKVTQTFEHVVTGSYMIS